MLGCRTGTSARQSKECGWIQSIHCVLLGWEVLPSQLAPGQSWHVCMGHANAWEGAICNRLARAAACAQPLSKAASLYISAMVLKGANMS